MNEAVEQKQGHDIPYHVTPKEVMLKAYDLIDEEAKTEEQTKAAIKAFEQNKLEEWDITQKAGESDRDFEERAELNLGFYYNVLEIEYLQTSRKIRFEMH